MPFNPKLHLFAILNDPCPQGMCLLAMVTTIKDKRPYDATCILTAGDHPFITHPSYVLYRLASEVRADHIRNMLEKQYYRPKEDFASAVLQRVADGVYASDETRPSVARYANSVGV